MERKWNLEENKKNMENTANKMMEIEEERMESKKKRMNHWKWSRRNRIGICWLCSDRNDWIQKISDSLHLEIGGCECREGDGNNKVQKNCNLVQLEVRGWLSCSNCFGLNWSKHLNYADFATSLLQKSKKMETLIYFSF